MSTPTYAPAYIEGYKARMEAKPGAAVPLPYDENTYECRLWLRGWDAAQAVKYGASSPEPPQALSPGHYLEALDRAHTLNVMVDELLATHPLIEHHEGARNCLRAAQDALGDLYQYLGQLMHEAEEARARSVAISPTPDKG